MIEDFAKIVIGSDGNSMAYGNHGDANSHHANLVHTVHGVCDI
jgi:hypothetical protein